MSNALFFIAIIPNFELQEEITNLKQSCKNLFASSKALNAPPHITLIPPFRVPWKKMMEVKERIKCEIKGSTPFFVTINGFGHFRKDVIYLDVESNKELRKIQKELQCLFSSKPIDIKSSIDTFKPHITIARKDLKKEIFYKALEHFNTIKFYRFFEVKAVYILKHDGKKWEIEHKQNF